MGKGTIISGGTDGLYQLTVNLDVTRITAELVKLDAAIAALVAKIAAWEGEYTVEVAKIQAELDAAWADHNYYLAMNGGKVPTMPPKDQAGWPTADYAKVQAWDRNWKLLQKLEAQLKEYRVKSPQERDSWLLTLAGWRKRKAWLERANNADREVSAWCADLTEDLTGEVATIEINGEAPAGLLIAPGFTDSAAYVAADDGILQPVEASTPAGVFYNLAIMPGWQKWKPTYRTGSILEITGLTATIQLDNATFSDRGSGQSANININQGGLDVVLTEVPINYMGCGPLAFAVDDHVVVYFIDQDWTQPEVIGFVDHPQACDYLMFVIELTGLGTAPNGEAAAPNGPTLYLAWDGKTNAPLAVLDEFGEPWEYPMAAGEDYDYWLGLLQAQYGANTTITAPAPLFAVDYTGAMTRIMTVETDPGWAYGIGGYQYVLSGQNTFYGWECEVTIPCESPSGWSYTLVDYDLAEQTTPNDAGFDDTWGMSAHGSLVETLAAEILINEDTGDCYRACEGSRGIERVLSWSVNFDLTSTAYSENFIGYSSQSVPPYAHLQYPDNQLCETALPTPAINQSAVLSVLNASGAADALFGPTLQYSGTFSATSTEVSDNTGASDIKSSSYSHTSSGTGLYTAVDGAEYAISWSQTSSGSLSKTPDSTWLVVGTFSGVRGVDYICDGIRFASALFDADSGGDAHVFVAIQSVEQGNGTATLSAPDPPILSDSNCFELTPVYTGRTQSYPVRAICSRVANSSTQNPWELPNNEALESAISGAIADYLNWYPPDGDNHWTFLPVIKKITPLI